MPVPSSTIHENPTTTLDPARQQDGVPALSPIVEEPDSLGYADPAPGRHPGASHSQVIDRAPFPPPVRSRELHPHALYRVNPAQASHADSVRQAERIDRMAQQADTDRPRGARSDSGSFRSAVPIVGRKQDDMDVPDR